MKKISFIRVFGERCSGTNYLESLLINNVAFCSDKKSLKSGVFGYKHWFFNNWDDLARSDDTLFLVIFRNPVNWLSSLNKTPFHCSPSLHNLSFSEFIRAEWSCIWDDVANVDKTNPKYGTEMMHERDPSTGKRFSNVLELRKAKLLNWLKMASYTTNIAYLSYEELLKSPESYLPTILERFNVSVKEFKNTNSYRGFGKKVYVPKPDPVIPVSDADFICKSLDWKSEKLFGYLESHVYAYTG